MDPVVAEPIVAPIDEDQAKARQILQQMVAQVPESVYGLERQIFIGDLVEKLPVESRTILHTFTNSFFLRMFTINASDIDLGGYGGQGSCLVQSFRIEETGSDYSKAGIR